MSLEKCRRPFFEKMSWPKDGKKIVKIRPKMRFLAIILIQSISWFSFLAGIFTMAFFWYSNKPGILIFYYFFLRKISYKWISQVLIRNQKNHTFWLNLDAQISKLLFNQANVFIELTKILYCGKFWTPKFSKIFFNQTESCLRIVETFEIEGCKWKNKK